MKIAARSIVTALALLPSALCAQAFPAKPVRLLVGFPAGGGVDVIARQLAQELAKPLGQPVVVDNRPGAAGNIAVELTVKSPPDGYTLLMGNVGSLAINPGLYTKLPFDTVRDLAPVSLVATVMLVVIVHPSLPVKSLRELVALAKSRPGQLNYGSAGSGGITHLAVELLKAQNGIVLLHVPYKGSAPAFTDLVGGQLQVMIDAIPAPLPFIQAGRLRALAVTATTRSPALPEVPTTAEAGFPQFVATGWQGIVAPAGTPAAIVNRLNAEIGKALTAPEFRDKLIAQGSDPAPGTPDQFGAFLRSELAKWVEVVRVSGAKLE
jgi:tripartite-type tricarboxylate transporter receptor subunit TctC